MVDSFSLVTIVHDDGTFRSDEICQRIRNAHQSGVSDGRLFDLILIDNSPRPIRDIQNLACELNAVHCWCDGYNTFHGPSMNMAAGMSDKDAIIYFCASHGRVVDQSWIADILEPLNDATCGIAGCLGPCLYDRISGNPKDWAIPQVHLQGAVAAMRRETMLKVPYSHRFPFEYSDVGMSLELLHQGYRLHGVQSIQSVGYGRAKAEGAKYVHDYTR